MVVAMVAASLAIDLGTLTQEARQDQKIADLAALDGVRALPADPTAAVLASTSRNGFECPDTDLSDGCGLTVQWSESLTGVFTNLPATLPLATAVRVTSQTFHDNDFPFVGDGRSVSRKGTASLGNGTGCYYPDLCEETPGKSETSVSPIGSVRVGSSLATLSSDATILNELLTQTVGGSYNLSAVGWQGLAAGNVSLAHLRTALGASVGSPNGVLDADMKFRRLLDATVDALNADGSPSSITASNFLVTIRNQVSATAGANLRLRRLFDIVGNVGSGNDVADATINVKDIVTGGLTLADSDHFATLDLGVADIPGLPGTGVTVKFGLLESPQTKTGPAKTDLGVYRTVARTAQVKLLVELKVNLSLAGGLITLPLTIPYYFDAAAAYGKLDTIHCASNNPTPTSVQIFGQTDIANSYVGTVTEASLASPTASVASTTTLGGVSVNLGLLLGSVGVTASLTGPLATQQIPGHSGLRTFSPDYTGETSQTIPGATTVPLPALGAGNLTVSLTGLGATLATLGLTPATVTNAILGLVNPLLTPLNNTVVAPITRGLGLSLGAGDLWAPPPQNCNPTSFNTDPTSSVGPAAPYGYQIPSLVG